MTNKFYNFYVPRFNEVEGSDWTSFKSTIDSNVDHTFQKTWELYYINDINKMDARLIQLWLNLYQIVYDDTDTVASKKLRFRKYITKYRDKGMEDIYLDLSEGIVGTRGVLYCGTDIVTRWDESRWDGGDGDTEYMKWPSDYPQFDIYFDVKTTNSGDLDQIVSLLSDKSVRPAFYIIYLIDSSFNILRTI